MWTTIAGRGILNRKYFTVMKVQYWWEVETKLNAYNFVDIPQFWNLESQIINAVYINLQKGFNYTSVLDLVRPAIVLGHNNYFR